MKHSQIKNDMRLYYRQEASKWEETLPMGNGSLGAMIWGKVNNERIGLNEESLWSGYYRDKNNKEARNHLDEVRTLIFNKNYKQAEQLIQKRMLGEFGESYLPLGDLNLEFHHNKYYSDYKRVLDIDHAISHVSYSVENIRYEREYFVSYPHKTFFIFLKCSAPILDVSVSFTSQLKYSIHSAKHQLQLQGQCPEHVLPSYIDSNGNNPVIQGTKGIQFDGTVKIMFCDGLITETEDSLRVQNASSAVISFSAVQKPEINQYSNYEHIKFEHVRDYQNIYKKTILYLGDQPDIPTDDRLLNLKSGAEDNALYSLYFQYGRYLLISSSREGSLPANLQGIWNWELRAPWSSNWTTNINTQMNYWPVMTCNLNECLTPYVEFVKRICEEGKKTASVNYGCKGFVHHHNADYWCNTSPVGVLPGNQAGQDGSVLWSMWPMGGAWMVCDLYRYYEYRSDNEFLKSTLYPMIRESVLFLLDWLIEHEGYYVTCPSTSPENPFIYEQETCCVGISSAMDLEIITDSFDIFKKVCLQLQLNEPLLDEVNEKYSRLAPLKIGSHGQLLEWHEEFEEIEPGHRHLSHLYGLFPSELFAKDKVMTKACIESLNMRLANGSGHTGWSCAWILNIYAILEDSDNAFKYLNMLLTRSTYDNLWDAHPPFQIDGNFGGIAGIANMFVQERSGIVKILPALPKQFKDGFVKGLRIKGYKAIVIFWENGLDLHHHVYYMK